MKNITSAARLAIVVLLLAAIPVFHTACAGNAATKPELKTATDTLRTEMKAEFDKINQRLDALEAKVNQMESDGGIIRQELTALRQELEALKGASPTTVKPPVPGGGEGGHPAPGTGSGN